MRLQLPAHALDLGLQLPDVSVSPRQLSLRQCKHAKKTPGSTILHSGDAKQGLAASGASHEH